ncbi:GHMP kinases [Candidatus Symbiothrix dinenymphae]|nr:GHMP kinases [Candidatus Symbiothrix dinenymphae]
MHLKLREKKRSDTQLMNYKLYRSKAPLRIGLAGGGSDVSPYSDLYGGAILNATISLYAYANIERQDLQMAGGKQDQYAATFGGVNYMEFYEGNKVIVNPLRIDKPHLHELENNLLLYFTQTTHVSSDIIAEQQKNVTTHNTNSVEAMHKIKAQAQEMKEALLTGKIDRIGEIFDEGFAYKRQMATNVSNPLLDEIYEAAKQAGASGGRISGAGGGGFMLFYCPNNKKFRVMKALERFGGQFYLYRFVKDGLFTWNI